MARGRPRVPREQKRKAVKVRLAPRMHAGQVTEPYRVMESIIATDRKDLAGVKIGIAWHTGWRPDADGVRTHGKCVRRSDLDRSLDSYDVMIVLNEQSWQAFDDAQKERLLFHELEHAQIARDKNGGPLEDDKGRVVIRMKRHDVADFACVIERFGLPPCLQDIDIHDGDRPLLKLAESGAASAKDASPPGAQASEPEGPLTIKIKFSGIKKVKCQVYVQKGAAGWNWGYLASLGNHEEIRTIGDHPPRPTRPLAVLAAHRMIDGWLADLPLTGGADRKRSDKSRVESARRQIAEQVAPYLPAEDPDEVPFDEDPPWPRFRRLPNDKGFDILGYADAAADIATSEAELHLYGDGGEP